MIDRVKATIRKYDIPMEGRNVVVCVSGGADSMALLHFLHANREELGILELSACHFNHDLRGEESDRDEQYVRLFCEENGIALETAHGDMNSREKPAGQSTEMWARRLRYEFIDSACEKHNALAAVAHNLNDSIETMLFNLSRGSGVRGMRGIRPTYGKIIRPFIEIPREEIELYCQKNNIHFVTDSSNLSDIYSRNSIRHRVIPDFESLNPAFLANAKRLTEHAQEAFGFIERQAEKLIADAKRENGYDIAVFEKADSYLGKFAVKLLLDEQFDSIDEIMVEECFLVASGKKHRVQIRGNAFFTETDGSFSIEHRSETREKPESVPVVFGRTHSFGGRAVVITLSDFDYQAEIDPVSGECPKYVDPEKIEGTLLLRSRETGDAFSSAIRGVTKSLKKLFNEEGIEAAERDFIPILSDEKGIVWICDQGPSARVATGPRSDKKLIIQVLEEQ